MNRNSPRDAQHRQTALDIEQSFIVQAPAGSGKTTLLVQRYLSLLTSVERPEQVVVITFTRKATGELRDRVLAVLEQAASGATGETGLLPDLAARVLARDQEKNWDILQLPSRLGIYTIDALCAVLVRQMPWLSGLGGMARIEEQPQRLYLQAVDNALAGLNAGSGVNEDLVRVFTHLDNDFVATRNLLMRMLGRREQWIPYLQSGEEFGGGLRESLQQGMAFIVEGRLADLRAAIPEPCRQPLLDLARAVGAAEAGRAGDSAYAVLRGIQELPGEAAAALPVWRALAGMLLTGGNKSLRRRDLKADALAGLEADDKRAINAAARELLQELADVETVAEHMISIAGLPDAVFEEGEWRLLLSLLEVLKLALAELRLIFAREGSVDFSEITAAALQALGPAEAPTDLGLTLDYQVQHLLVDEFQDTSRVHYELVERLCAGFTSDDGRSVFLVGDPMQSIYRFREAEVGLFLDCMQSGLVDLDINSLLLEANFRSRPSLVEWVNRTFSRVFPPRHDPPRSCVAHAAAEARRPEGEDPPVTLYGTRDAGSAQQQAGRVVEIVARTRRVRPEQSIAVLVRSRSHLEFILPALRAAGLRYRGMEIEPLASVAVVRDLHALTRALLQPADRVSWLAVLRAPWCGLRLSDLHALVADDINTSVPALLDDRARRGRLDAPTRERLEAVLSALAMANGASRSLRLKRRVEACWIALGGPGYCDFDQVGDARRYFELLDALEAGGASADLDFLEARLDDLYASPCSGEVDLDIMTMHKAKGLEFDQVILPYLEKTPRASDPPLLQWTEVAFTAGTCLVFAAKPAADGDTSRYRFVSNLEAEKQRNEAARLLYVACTRAREQLHLLYGLNSDSKGGLRDPSGTSLLAQLWPVMREQLEQDLATTQDPDAPLTGATPSIRRLTHGWQMPDMGKALCWQPEIELPEPGYDQGLEFDWAGRTARHIGSLVHRMLREIVEQGLDVWTTQRIEDRLPHFVSELENLGVPSEQLHDAGRRVVAALLNTLADGRGRWLLAAEHIDSHCEWPLCGLSAGLVRTVYMDRSFVDAQNVRWIVDYKTGWHGGGDLEGFLDAEQQRYATQLQHYGEILSNLDSRPIRLGLYFPLFGGWCEWAFEKAGRNASTAL